jgi:hypothetical protein
MSTRVIRCTLRKIFKHDKHWLTNCERHEKNNPFPGVDMNYGWYRARCELLMHFEDNFGGAEEIKRVREGFEAFDMWRQLDPFVLPQEWEAMFDRLFVGASRGKSEWGRSQEVGGQLGREYLCLVVDHTSFKAYRPQSQRFW